MFVCDRQESGNSIPDQFGKMLTVLNTVSEKASHNQCQEHIVVSHQLSLTHPIAVQTSYYILSILQSALQSLCDVELSLVEDLTNVRVETQLANELPDLECLEQIITALLEHIGNYDHCYSSILQSLRTLLMMTEYNYTYNTLRRSVTYYLLVAASVSVFISGLSVRYFILQYTTVQHKQYLQPIYEVKQYI